MLRSNLNRFSSYSLFVCIFLSLFSCRPDLEINSHKNTDYIAIFGDIQYYTYPTYIGLFSKSLDWLEQQRSEGCNIKCVLHTGDITHQPNSLSQWQTFGASMKGFSRVIPFYSMIGNHDYSWSEGNRIINRYDTHFNEYVQFQLSIKNVIAQFEPGRMENVIIKNSIQGQRLDLLILEFGPREEVVEWADKYVKEHPNHRFILMTHEYLEKGGGRRINGSTCIAQLQNTSVTTPEQLWINLVKCNKNILCVLCGHVGSLYSFSVDINDFGCEVPQIQHNIQGPSYRYDNWLMMWEFPSDSDSANVFIYNTKTEQYFNDQTSLFKFKYRN